MLYYSVKVTINRANKNCIIFLFFQITKRKTGPAFTLRVPSSNGDPIDIDLVPILAFPISNPLSGYSQKKLLSIYNNNPLKVRRILDN